MIVDVYVKGSKNEEFKRYHFTNVNIYKLCWLLHSFRDDNIIEDFYIYEIVG